MIKHIVMWKLKDFAEGCTKRENAIKIKNELESLKAVIPEIIDIEVGIDILNTSQSYDLVLYSKFKNQYDLDIYQNHVDHKRIAEFIGQVRLERVVVDYEV